MDSSRLLFYGIWGVGVLVIYAIVVYKRWLNHMAHHDRRSKRDLIEGIALGIVALAASASVASVIFWPDFLTGRGFLTSVALGGFFATGIIMATEEKAQE